MVLATGPPPDEPRAFLRHYADIDIHSAERRTTGTVVLRRASVLACSRIAHRRAEAYAKSVVLADFQEPGDADVLNKIVGDLQKAGLSHTEAEIRRMMDELLAQAAKEVEKGTSGRE